MGDQALRAGKQFTADHSTIAAEIVLTARMHLLLQSEGGMHACMPFASIISHVHVG